MSRIDRFFNAMLTRNTPHADSESYIMLIGNVAGIDRMQYTFPTTSQDDQKKSQANIYQVPTLNAPFFDTQRLGQTYFRVGIRRSDTWDPEHYFLWSTTQNPFSVVPIGINLDLKTTGVIRSHSDQPHFDNNTAHVVLSTENSKGDLSFPLMPVAAGNGNTLIRRLMVLMTTKNSSDAGTGDRVQLQVKPAGKSPVIYDFPDSPQSKRVHGKANWYFVPVTDAFTKHDLSLNSRSITLFIEGDDAWDPESFYIFGLDTLDGAPAHVVPLVHMNPWGSVSLSTDESEGHPFRILPILP